MKQNVSLDIDNFINNDPAILLIFFSLSLFASIVKLVFSEKKIVNPFRTAFKLLLTSATSSIVIFSLMDDLRKYFKGNSIYLAAFLFGFICDLIIKRLVEIKSFNGLIKFIDDFYNFLKSRKK